MTTPVRTLLPPNAAPAELALEAATARLGDVPIPLRPLWNPMTCPAALLPWLAWSLSVDTWNPDWPESIKRTRIARAIEIQRKKGTLDGIRAIVAVFGGAVRITEWWQQVPRGTPHTFTVTLQVSDAAAGSLPTARLIDDVITEIRRTKPARSHFSFVLGATAAAGVRLAAAARATVAVRLSAAA